MATCGLAVKSEAARLQLPDDLSIPESGKPAHSRRDHYGVVSPVVSSRQVRNTLTLTPGINQLAGNIASNIERLGNGPSLRHEAWEFVRRRKIQALR
jgi:hypothetical protein